MLPAFITAWLTLTDLFRCLSSKDLISACFGPCEHLGFLESRKRDSGLTDAQIVCTFGKTLQIDLWRLWHQNMNKRPEAILKGGEKKKKMS